MWMKKCEGFTSPNQKHMWSAAVCVCFKGPTLSVTQPVFQRLASDSGKQRERTETNTVTFSASHRLHPVLPKVCLFSSNSSIFSGSCSSIVSLSPFYRVTPFLTSMAGHVARRLWWPEARSLLAGHGSEGSRVCVCVYGRRGETLSFGSGVEFARTRVELAHLPHPSLAVTLARQRDFNQTGPSIWYQHGSVRAKREAENKRGPVSRPAASRPPSCKKLKERRLKLNKLNTVHWYHATIPLININTSNTGSTSTTQ